MLPAYQAIAKNIKPILVTASFIATAYVGFWAYAQITSPPAPITKFYLRGTLLTVPPGALHYLIRIAAEDSVVPVPKGMEHVYNVGNFSFDLLLPDLTLYVGSILNRPKSYKTSVGILIDARFPDETYSNWQLNLGINQEIKRWNFKNQGPLYGLSAYVPESQYPDDLYIHRDFSGNPDVIIYCSKKNNGNDICRELFSINGRIKARVTAYFNKTNLIRWLEIKEATEKTLNSFTNQEPHL